MNPAASLFIISVFCYLYAPEGRAERRKVRIVYYVWLLGRLRSYKKLELEKSIQPILRYSNAALAVLAMFSHVVQRQQVLFRYLLRIKHKGEYESYNEETEKKGGQYFHFLIPFKIPSDEQKSRFDEEEKKPDSFEITEWN